MKSFTAICQDFSEHGLETCRIVPGVLASTLRFALVFALLFRKKHPHNHMRDGTNPAEADSCRLTRKLKSSVLNRLKSKTGAQIIRRPILSSC